MLLPCRHAGLVVLLFALALLLPTSGCSGFVTSTGTPPCSDFLHSSTCTTSGGGGGSTVNYAFVGNTGSNTVSGLSISATGMLSALAGSPISLTVPPTAMAVSRSNSFLWVGTATSIFGYAISPTGVISGLNNGAAIANANCIDMQTSPDGKWLMVLDGGLLSGAGASIDLFSIGADGTLATATGIILSPTGTVVPKALRLNPAGTLVAAALGNAGEVLANFDTGTGAFTQLAQTVPPSLTSDNGISFDNNGAYLYLARSGTNAGLVVTTIAANGALVPTTSSVYATGAQPYAVVVDTTGKYVYVANRGDSTITGYAIGTNAALTPIGGSPFASGSAVTQLGVDSSGKWLLGAAFGGTPDLTLYGFDPTTVGKLVTTSTMATGTNASVLVMSH